MEEFILSSTRTARSIGHLSVWELPLVLCVNLVAGDPPVA